MCITMLNAVTTKGCATRPIIVSRRCLLTAHTRQKYGIAGRPTSHAVAGVGRQCWSHVGTYTIRPTK